MRGIDVRELSVGRSRQQFCEILSIFKHHVRLPLTGQVVPKSMQLARCTIGVRALKLLFHLRRKLDIDQIPATISLSTKEPHTPVERLMDIAYQMLQPDKVIGFKIVVFARTDG